MKIDDLALYVDDRGSGDAIVLLHGFSGSTESWRAIADDLSRDHRVIAIDIIGHGRSDAPADPSRYGFLQAIDDLHAIANELGLEQATWLGYSMGGRLALGYALRHPRRVSSLILESASPGIADERERRTRKEADDALARQIEERGIEWFVDHWQRLPLWESQNSLPPDVLRQQRAVRLRNLPVGLANALRGMGQGAQPSLWDRLGDLTMPALLIVGELDPKYAAIAARMLDSMSEAELVVVPRAGHAIHLERPRQFITAVRRRLARHECQTAVAQEAAR